MDAKIIDTKAYREHLLVVARCKHTLATFPKTNQIKGTGKTLINYVEHITICTKCGYLTRVESEPALISDGKHWSLQDEP